MVKKRRRRRNWDDDEKQMICAQTRFAGVSVSQVARRYDVNANQVFNWLKDPQFAASQKEEDAVQFLPVEVAGPVQPPPVSACERGEMRIKFSNGIRVKIIGSFDPEALAVLIRKLST